MAARPRTIREKALQLACWNADDVRIRKLVLEHFLSESGVYICLLNETHLDPGRTLSFANYVSHRTDRQTLGGGTVILVHKGIDLYAEPVSVCSTWKLLPYT
jgi:hypothetical protein